jgi:hypothetical protein
MNKDYFMKDQFIQGLLEHIPIYSLKSYLLDSYFVSQIKYYIFNLEHLSIKKEEILDKYDFPKVKKMELHTYTKERKFPDILEKLRIDCYKLPNVIQLSNCLNLKELILYVDYLNSTFDISPLSKCKNLSHLVVAIYPFQQPLDLDGLENINNELSNLSSISLENCTLYSFPFNIENVTLERCLFSEHFIWGDFNCYKVKNIIIDDIPYQIIHNFSMLKSLNYLEIINPYPVISFETGNFKTLIIKKTSLFNVLSDWKNINNLKMLETLEIQDSSVIEIFNNFNLCNLHLPKLKKFKRSLTQLGIVKKTYVQKIIHCCNFVMNLVETSRYGVLYTSLLSYSSQSSMYLITTSNINDYVEACLFYIDYGRKFYYLTKCLNLEYLNLKNCFSDLSGIVQLTSLKELRLTDWIEGVANFPSLENLTNLEILKLKSFNIKILPSLEKLTNLKQIIFKNNKLEILPKLPPNSLKNILIEEFFLCDIGSLIEIEKVDELNILFSSKVDINVLTKCRFRKLEIHHHEEINFKDSFDGVRNYQQDYGPSCFISIFYFDD